MKLPTHIAIALALGNGGRFAGRNRPQKPADPDAERAAAEKRARKEAARQRAYHLSQQGDYKE